MKKMMRLFLMSVLCGILPITMLFGGVSVAAYTGYSTQSLATGADIRVMSYNTLVDNDEANGGWSWGKPLANRAEKAAAAIKAAAAQAKSVTKEKEPQLPAGKKK